MAVSSTIVPTPFWGDHDRIFRAQGVTASVAGVPAPKNDISDMRAVIAGIPKGLDDLTRAWVLSQAGAAHPSLAAVGTNVTTTGDYELPFDSTVLRSSLLNGLFLQGGILPLESGTSVSVDGYLLRDSLKRADSALTAGTPDFQSPFLAPSYPGTWVNNTGKMGLRSQAAYGAVVPAVSTLELGVQSFDLRVRVKTVPSVRMSCVFLGTTGAGLVGSVEAFGGMLILSMDGLQWRSKSYVPRAGDVWQVRVVMIASSRALVRVAVNAVDIFTVIVPIVDPTRTWTGLAFGDSVGEFDLIEVLSPGALEPWLIVDYSAGGRETLPLVYLGARASAARRVRG